jgi:Polysaccharide lyase
MTNPAGVTFIGDYSSFGSEFQLKTVQTQYVSGKPVMWIADWNPNRWRMVAENAIDRLTAVADPSSPQKGTVLNVQVLPGDTLGDAGGERAEVFRMLDAFGKEFPVTPASGHEHYAVAVRLDPYWKPPLHNPANGNWQWGIFLQLHSPDQFGSPPALALTATDHFGVAMLTGDLTPGGVRRNGDNYPLTDAVFKLGRWVEFMIDVIWSYGDNGSVTVLRRDEGEAVFVPVFTKTGPTLQYDSQIADSQSDAYVHYWRAGFYRSVSPGVVSKLRLSPVIRGTNQAACAAAAF